MGCQTFIDGLWLIVLDKRKCEKHAQCSGKKEIDLKRTGCWVLPSKTQYFYNDTWKPLEVKTESFEITDNKPFLKVIICTLYSQHIQNNLLCSIHSNMQT